MKLFLNVRFLTTVLVSMMLPSVLSAGTAEMKDFACGEPIAHYPLGIERICYGSKRTEIGYALWLRTENENKSITLYRLSNERIATEAKPVVDHTLFSKDGKKVGTAVLTHEVEDARYPGDGEDRVVALKVSLENGTVFRAYLEPISE